MQNSEYWKLRFEQLEAAQNRQGVDAVAEIDRQYKEAQKQLEGQIARWYQRFADNNRISLAQAHQYMKGADLKEFKWDVNDYIKYGKENAINGQWVKQLENASAKFHISRLEALKIHTQQNLEVMCAKQLGTVTGAMSGLYKSGYYHTAYELQKGFGIGWDIAGLDQSQIEKVLAKPWAVDGKNFSERIWGNKQKLISEVHGELTQNIMLGADPQKAIDSLAKKMNTSKNNAGRLVMTEEAYFSSAAQRDCFNELDVEQYEIVATLDSNTSEICRSLDGKVFPIKEFQPGVTAPPFHVYCRSTTVPYFGEDFGDIGERAARDEETGKTYYVPEDMNYKEWEKAFANGGDKSKLKNIENSGENDITEEKTVPLASQHNSISELSSKAAEILKNNYEANRNHFNLNLVPADEVDYEWVSYKGLSPEIAANVDRVLSDLQSQYYSTLSKVEVKRMGEKSGIAAYVEPAGYNASSRMELNSDLLKDKNFHAEIVKFNATPKSKGAVAHAVEIVDGKETDYFVTHEFAHSVFTTRPQKELISIYGEKTGKTIDSVQRKIKKIYKDYVNEIGPLESELFRVEKSLENGPDDFIELMSKHKEIVNKIEEIKISKYAVENVDEFIAESFTQMRIGKNKSPYAQKTGELIDSVFKKNAVGVDKSGESGIIKESNKKTITPITDNSVERVSKVKIQGYSDEQCEVIQNQHKELLKYSRDNNENKEVAFVFDNELKNRKEFKGSDDRLDFGGTLYGKDLFVMHNHPRNSSYSLNDVVEFIGNDCVKTLTIVKNNGKTESLTKLGDYDKLLMLKELKRLEKNNVKTGSDNEYRKIVDKFLNKYVKEDVIEWLK